MKRILLRHVVLVSMLLVTVLGVGCVSVPQKEFKAYNDAFTQTKGVTEQLLLEYDSAKRTEAERKAARTGSIELSPPYPANVTLTLKDQQRSSEDPVAARREALEAVSTYNSLLVSLAEGKKPEEIKAVTGSFIGELNNISKMLGSELAIPYAGQVGALVSTAITKLQEAENRNQFIAALREAEPVIQGVLLLFAQDAQDIYQIRALQTYRLWSDHQDRAATLVRQMRDVAKERAGPADDEKKEKLANLVEEARNVLDRVGLKENSAELPTVGHTNFDHLALSQLRQTLDQAKFEAGRYEAVIKEQAAFYELIVSYGRLLGQTKASLTAVRLALDAPSDILQQAKELTAFVFEVRRNWEALNAARRAAINN